ncbi:helix-turn-helix domain-containing protein [Promicromonospora sp. NPDC059942]|uniref:helix-turn-helix domain-containing protein n=1 Tax=Promicromonospora sp. NPDC059942 TaxID=3347009 RepID=UPI00365130FC
MAHRTWNELRTNRTEQMTPAERETYKKAYDEAALAHELATLVYDARTAVGITQAELARRMGTHQSVIARLENGGGMPSIPTLDRLARALGMHLTIAVGDGEQGPVVDAG